MARARSKLSSSNLFSGFLKLKKKQICIERSLLTLAEFLQFSVSTVYCPRWLHGKQEQEYVCGAGERGGGLL